MKTIPVLRLFIGAAGFLALVGFPQAQAVFPIVGDLDISPSATEPGNLTMSGDLEVDGDATIYGTQLAIGGYGFQYGTGYGQLIIANPDGGFTNPTVSFYLANNPYGSENYRWGYDSYYGTPQMHLSTSNILSLYPSNHQSPNPSIELIPNQGYSGTAKITINGNDVLTTASNVVIPSSNQAITLFGSFGSSTTSVAGSGTRMMWHPGKAAFRAGYSTSNNWDEAYIGAYSAAFGNGTRASGGYSTALGMTTIASGTVSTAMGRSTTASGMYSTAMGYGTTAYASSSTVVGSYNVNTGTGDDVFVVGGGASATSRFNALLVRKNGSLAAGAGTAIGNVPTGSSQVVVGAYNDLSEDLTTSPITTRANGVFAVGAGVDTNTRKNALRVTTTGKVLVQPSGELTMGTFTSGEKP